MKTLLLFSLVLFASCISVRNGEVKKRDAHFGVVPLQGWLQKSFRGADLFFEHQSQLATIFVNAECNKFSDVPLEVLTGQLLIDLSDINYIKQEHINLAERAGLLSEISAKIDGVPRFLKIVVLRKNKCVFDAVFNSAPNMATLATDFDKLIATFWAKVEL